MTIFAFQTISILYVKLTAIQNLIVNVALHSFKVEVKVFRTAEAGLVMVQVGVGLRVKIASITSLGLPIKVKTVCYQFVYINAFKRVIDFS